MTLDEYARFVAQTTPVVWVAGLPWEVSRKVMKPLALPHAIGSVDRSAVRSAMRKHGAAMGYWTEEWDRSPSSWWYVICDDPEYAVERLSYEGRRGVRVSLRRCQIRQIEPAFVAEHGYAVYQAAASRYEGFHGVSQEVYARGYQARQGNKGFRFFGAFVEDKLVAYLSSIVVDDVAMGSAMKFDPAFSSSWPTNGLLFEFTRHFLRDRHFRYCSNGQRNLVHQTRVQDFQVKRLGYRRAYCRLCVETSPALSLAVKSGVGRWGKYLGLSRLAPGSMRGVQAAAQLARLAAHSDDEAADIGPPDASRASADSE